MGKKRKVQDSIFSRMRNARSSATTRCQHWWGVGGYSSEQVWTGIQQWPPDVSSRGEGAGPRSDVQGEVPCHLSQNACDVPTPMSTGWWTDLWKHYLSATSLAVGKYCSSNEHLNNVEMVTSLITCLSRIVPRCLKCALWTNLWTPMNRCGNPFVLESVR